MGDLSELATGDVRDDTLHLRREGLEIAHVHDRLVLLNEGVQVHCILGRRGKWLFAENRLAHTGLCHGGQASR